ncbi:MAG TPA: hypothetical protein VE081_14225 [Sporichthyaceae bacterium]|nr:hypothetical protein [Sporichthyaceae bacterium]
MPPRPFVPAELLHGPFHRSIALAAGLSPDQLRSRCWIRLFPQVYVHSSVNLTDEMRFAALRLAAPEHAVATGLTAAWLFGAWTPRRGRAVPLHVATARGTADFITPGARTGRLVLDPEDMDTFHGVGVTTPVRTCFGLMRQSSLTEAVVWADVFLHAGLICEGSLARYADERPHWSHVCKVREAAGLARAAAASPMETRLRLVIVFGGLPEPPLINVPVYDAYGNLLGIPDLQFLLPRRFGLEYDGEEYHGEPEQHRSDLVRENQLLLGDVPLLRYTAPDVFGNPRRIVREVGAMLCGAA